MHRSRRLSSLWRTSALALVFEKCLTVSPDELSRPDLNIGRILTMASSDIENIKEFPMQMMYLWMAPSMLTLYVAFLFVLVGPSALAAVVLFAASLPVQAALTNAVGGAQKSLTSCTDQRLRRTSELLSGIRVVKTMGWESRFISAIESGARAEELRFRRRLQICQVGLWACVFSTPTFMIAAVLASYTLSGHRLDASVVLPLIAVVSAITFPVMMLPEAFSSLAKFTVSAGRITQFLESDDSHIILEHAERVFSAAGGGAADRDAQTLSAASVNAAKVLVSSPNALPVYKPRHGGLRRVTERILCAVLRRLVPVELQWRRAAVSPATSEGDGEPAPDAAEHGDGDAILTGGEDEDSGDAAGELYAMEDKALLRDVGVSFPRGKLTMVVGATGSGKSVLLATLLGAYRFEGRVDVARSVAYVPQQPWIMQATLEANVTLFKGHRHGTARATAAAGAGGDGAFGRELAPVYSPLRCAEKASGTAAFSQRGGSRTAVCERLARALRSCQLDADLEQMAQGMQTEIGERGINLSGGQKARVSLARAVYADCDMYVLDDPLSALDAHVGRRVMGEVVLRALAGKTRVLATYQLQFLPHADQVVVLREGSVVFAGSYAAYASSEWKAHVEHEEAATAASASGKNGAGGGGDPAVAEDQELSPAGLPVASVRALDATPEELDRALHAGADCGGAQEDAELVQRIDGTSLKLHRRDSRDSEDANAKSCTDDGCTLLRTLDATHTSSVVLRSANDSGGLGGDEDAADGGDLMTMEEKETGHIPWSVYRTYFEAGGGLRVAIRATLQCLLGEILSTATSVWLTLWSVNSFGSFLSANEQLGVYLGFLLASSLTVSANDLFILQCSRRAARRLHATLLHTVSSATLAFFDRTPLGRAVNRFSKDIFVLDDELPANVIPFLGIGGYITTSLAVTLYTSPFSIVVLLLAAYAFGRLLKFYATVVREVRRRGSVAQSPLFSLLEDVVHGRATIAVYDKSHVLLAEALRRLDLVYSCTYVEKVMTLWLALRIEYIAAFVIVAVGLIGVLEKLIDASPVMPEARVGLISLSLTMCLDLSWSLSSILDLAAVVEASMNSVQRVCHYIRCVPKEALLLEPREAYAMQDGMAHNGSCENSNWSASAASEIVVAAGDDDEGAPAWQGGATGSDAGRDFGALRLEHVDMRYRPGLPLVLRDVCFAVAPGQKVGVVGRTGSGKSTLLLAFLRLVDVCGGRILVCGRDARTYPLPTLRRLFSMIPQDPLLFDGTVRSNVDPFGDATDREVLEALVAVGFVESGGCCSPAISPTAAMPSALTRRPNTVFGGTPALETVVQAGGSNFSVGQRQLLCLARALLKKGSAFILMDEATANVDARLDQTVQRVVAEKFGAYTVVTIAHRLHTVAAYDVVLVMDRGRVVEMGSPRELLERRASVFYGMLAQSAAVTVAREHLSREDAAGAVSGPTSCDADSGGTGLSTAERERRVEDAVASLLRQCK
ncbi:hypothetical protein LSCM1_01446 [Leishmania martiniquensis]|nr:hypothetical protein LSCM1_01446 [Leishmania martiniquensis]